MSSWRPQPPLPAPDRAAPRRRARRRGGVGLRTPHTHAAQHARAPNAGAETRRRRGPTSS
eukprot:5866366-Pleurochrysis_carterae.AAC.1